MTAIGTDEKKDALVGSQVKNSTLNIMISPSVPDQFYKFDLKIAKFEPKTALVRKVR